MGQTEWHSVVASSWHGGNGKNLIYHIPHVSQFDLSHHQSLALYYHLIMQRLSCIDVFLSLRIVIFLIPFYGLALSEHKSLMSLCETVGFCVLLEQNVYSVHGSKIIFDANERTSMDT